MHTAVTDYVTHCYELAKACGLPSDAYTLEAFRYLLHQRTSSTTSSPPAQPDERAPTDTQPNVGPLSTLAQVLRLDIDVVEIFFTWSDDGLTLHLPLAALPSKRSAATRDIAILFTVANTYAGLASETPYSAIRAVCDSYNVFDAKNFTATLAGLSPKLITTGRGHHRNLVAKQPAIELARSLLEKYRASI